MAFRDAIVSDWKCWADRENVTLIAEKNSGDMSYALSATGGAAKRRALTFKELAASGGVYTAQDMVWLVPSANLPAGVVPKMADRVRDSGANDWTVLEVALNKLRCTYRLVTRNLVIALDLRDRVDIWAPTNTQDDPGNRVPDYGQAPLYSQVPARVQPVGEEVVEAFGKRGLAKHYKCYLGRAVTVTAEYQVRLGSTVYQITGTANMDRIDFHVELDLEILP